MALPHGVVGWYAVCVAFLDLLLNEANMSEEDTLPFYLFKLLKGIYLSKALTCMKLFLYRQKCFFYQGNRYL